MKLFILSATCMIATMYLIFVWVSTEITMGIIRRIFYFHVPAATAAFWGVFVGGFASVLYLKSQDASYDDLAVAANESVLVFSAVNIILGSMWSRRAWGVWWAWDARLTSSLLLVLIYVAYFAVRKAAPVERRGTVGSVVCLFGMADVPLIYMSNRLFRTPHPGPVIGGGEGSGLEPDMLFTFLFAHVAMLLLWWTVVRTRRWLAELERRIDAASLLAFERVA